LKGDLTAHADRNPRRHYSPFKMRLICAVSSSSILGDKQPLKHGVRTSTTLLLICLTWSRYLPSSLHPRSSVVRSDFPSDWHIPTCHRSICCSHEWRRLELVHLLSWAGLRRSSQPYDHFCNVLRRSCDSAESSHLYICSDSRCNHWRILLAPRSGRCVLRHGKKTCLIEPSMERTNRCTGHNTRMHCRSAIRLCRATLGA